MIAGYVLQLGSYFGSWRLGFGEGEPLAGAIVYGLIAGVLVIVAFVAVFIVAGIFMQASPSLGAILMALLFLPLVAALYTVWAALIAIVLFIVMLLVLAFGASMSDMNPAAALTGGGGVAVLVILALLAVLLWLSARFSCATSIMADRRTFNLLTGLSESWRLTAASQWRIVGYLALLSVVLMVLFVVLAMIVGVGMAQSLQGGGVPEVGLGMIIATLVISIPLAYLTVLVPAGIYRELGGGETSAKVFAWGIGLGEGNGFSAHRCDNTTRAMPPECIQSRQRGLRLSRAAAPAARRRAAAGRRGAGRGSSRRRGRRP